MLIVVGGSGVPSKQSSAAPRPPRIVLRLKFGQRAALISPIVLSDHEKVKLAGFCTFGTIASIRRSVLEVA